MSTTTPILQAHRAEFVSVMADAERDAASAAMGMTLREIEWLLLNTATEFMGARRYEYGDPQSAVEQYRRLRADASPGVDT